MSEQETFFVDDFFVIDESETVEVEMNGKQVPIIFKKKLGWGDRNAAKAKAIVYHLDPAGKPVVDRIDDTAFAEEILLRSIISWPFTFQNGKKLPVTLDNIRKLSTSCGDALQQVALERIMQRDAAQTPFLTTSEKTSEDHS